MQEINAWLEGEQDYDAGFLLFNKYGKSTFIKELLAKGISPFNKKRLFDELTKLAPPPPTLPVGPKEASHIIELSPSPIKSIAENQVRYFSLREDLKNTYRQMENNMLALDHVNDEHTLHQTAKQILKLHTKIRGIWMQLDYYDENKQFPAEAIEKVPVTSAMQRLHVSISKAKKRLKDPKCRDREATQKLLKAKQSALTTLQAQLKRKGSDE